MPLFVAGCSVMVITAFGILIGLDVFIRHDEKRLRRRRVWNGEV